MKVDIYDGAALEPFYSPPAFTGQDPQAQIENCIPYFGSCHCGAVNIALRNSGSLNQKIAPTEPVEGVIGECDCSICARVRGSKLMNMHHSFVVTCKCQEMLMRVFESRWAEFSPKIGRAHV